MAVFKKTAGKIAPLFLLPLLLVCVNTKVRRAAVIKITPVDYAREYVLGAPNAEITLIEYSDFECGYCRRHHATVYELLKAYPRKLNLVYRHFPLKSHPHAMPAAKAAECAGELGGRGAFWKFADLLFNKGPESANYPAYAKLSGLNAVAFRACIKENRHGEKIKSHINSGTRAGLRGTPYNLLIHNPTGRIRIIEGAYPPAHFKKNIDELLRPPVKTKADG